MASRRFPQTIRFCRLDIQTDPESLPQRVAPWDLHQGAFSMAIPGLLVGCAGALWHVVLAYSVSEKLLPFYLDDSELRSSVKSSLPEDNSSDEETDAFSKSSIDSSDSFELVKPVDPELADDPLKNGKLWCLLFIVINLLGVLKVFDWLEKDLVCTKPQPVSCHLSSVVNHCRWNQPIQFSLYKSTTRNGAIWF